VKVRISYTVDCDQHFRKALAARFGKPGLATRADIKSWYEQKGDLCDANLLYDFDHRTTELRNPTSTKGTLGAGQGNCPLA
jgi:hypothetical protein